jgi:hypothetical protein
MGKIYVYSYTCIDISTDIQTYICIAIEVSLVIRIHVYLYV